MHKAGRRRLLTALAAAGLLGGLVLLPPAQVSAPAAGPTRLDGDAGLGDSYFPQYGNSGYRVGHYRVRIGFDPADDRLHGTTLIRAHATQRLTRFHLDLALRAGAVVVNGHRARFDQSAHELVVRPDTAIARGHAMRVRVDYTGMPADRRINGYTPWVTTSDGAAAVGEPESAAWWFPSNDHPSDKASFDVSVTVPRGVEAVSNGRLAARRAHGGLTTWRWRSSAPLATYLAFVVVGDLHLVTTRAGGRPFVYAVSNALRPATRRNALAGMRWTAQATRFLAHRWGRYPFGQIGGVVVGPPTTHNFGYALETQTRPVYDPGFFGAGPSHSLVVHEMAHQWFGDAVSVRRWKHIWLNEGFATYSEWLLSGHQGARTPNEIFHSYYDNLEPSNGFWKLTIGDPGPSHLFDSRVYDRGAMTVHALRSRLGDRDFFATARRWVHDNRDGLGTTKELKALAERVSGQQLDGLFRAWLQTARKPAATRANGVVG